MKKLLIASALIAATGASQAEFALNGGFVSDYIFRGSQLGDAGAYGSVEYSKAGFTAGVWAIQDGGENGPVEDATNTQIDDGSSTGGLEYDAYISYGMDFNDDLSAYLGYTQYNYSYASNYESEINVGAAFGPVALDAAIGKATAEDDSETDYTYIALSGTISNIGLLVGSADIDDAPGSNSDYMHFEASTSADLEAIGASISLVLGHNEPDDDAESGTQYMYFDLSKDFEF